MPADDYYRVLSIPQNASREDIKRAYHRLVLQCHPDLHSMMPDAEDRLRQVIEAHRVLADPESRAQYDRTRTLGSPMWRYQAASTSITRIAAERRACAIKALIFTIVLAAVIVHIGLILNNGQPTPIDWEEHSAYSVSLAPAISTEQSTPAHTWPLWQDQSEGASGDCYVSLDHSAAFSTTWRAEDSRKQCAPNF